MGASESRPTLVPPFERLGEWTLSRVEKLLADYLAKDLDFGLDYHGLSSILDGDKEWSERIIKAFGSQNGLINVLSFITGACLVVSGTPDEKAALCFKAFDFSGTGSISMDETTIMFMCALRGFSMMTGNSQAPTDEAMEICTIELYKSLEKDNYSKLTKEEFLKWVVLKLHLDNSKDLTWINFHQVFGMKSNDLSAKAPDAARHNSSDQIASSDSTLS
ncbi:hypothetical protein THRCLA_21510 [Thraustotheca clavata]|uniref:EF-hand domain-containing protein n=1 Tax=Thraustotheca clavata TaxID=74557 RepID=A0A1V9ZWC8_9STRA|nr:hypothetical protein THRCLA_21510 [Thraustotheca clavata]